MQRSLLASCKSKEEKANVLIKEYFYKTLHDFASYEPVETKIDSAFKSIYYDSLSMQYGLKIKKYMDEVDKSLEESKTYKDIMEIWAGYSSSKYKEAFDNYKSHLEQAELSMKNVREYIAAVKLRAEELKPEFYGWQAKHKFRCKTAGGTTMLANYLYIFDVDFKKILYKEDTDDKDVETARNYIDQALVHKSEKTD